MEGLHDAARGMLGGLIEGFGIVFKGSLLQGPDAILTPAGSGDSFDQHGLGRRLRVVLFDQALVKIEEGLGLFALQHDGLGEEAVDGAVAGELRLPCSVMGPLDRAPLARDDWICLEAHCGFMVAAVAGGVLESEEGCH